MAMQQLLDAAGRPVRRETLATEIAGPTIGGVRSPISGYPADGLTPVKLATILRCADQGDPLSFLELAETIEERDPHYLGVLGTRRRSVSQVQITVDAASDNPDDEAIAQEIRDWIKRDELQDELFDILDCIGKGYSFTEIIWDSSEGQWQPLRLEYRDPRWFRFDRETLRQPVLIDAAGELPLEPFKFIFAAIKAKSGLTLRSGLARVAAWGWMFKAYTQRDWAIFSQTYGQPVRVGKFDTSASEDDKATLFRAVSNIAGDCAAIIPASMQIEFIEAANVGAAHQLYKERADWLDQQISKAVLGQTSTTDAVVGGLGSGKEHRQVQKDIQQADCRALAAILNRDLVRPFVQLNHGPQKAYPRLKIEEIEQEDLKALADAIGPMIDRGLEVDQATISERFGLPEAKSGAKLMRPQGGSAPLTVAPDQKSKIERVPAVFKGGQPLPGMETAPQAESLPAAKISGGDATAPLTDRMAIEAGPAMDAILARIDQMVTAAASLEELRQMLVAGFPDLEVGDLAETLALGLLAANLAGRTEVAHEATQEAAAG